MSGTMHRRVARLEGSEMPGLDLATAIEAGRRRVHGMSAAELHRERMDRADELRARAGMLNRAERDMLAGLERALAA